MFRVVEIVFYGILAIGLIISTQLGNPYISLLSFLAFALNWGIGSRWYFNHKKTGRSHVQRFGPIISGLGLFLVFLAVPFSILFPASGFERITLVGLVLVCTGLLANSIIHRKHLSKTWLFGIKALVLSAPVIWLCFSSLHPSGSNFQFRTAIVKNESSSVIEYKILEHQALLKEATEKRDHARTYQHAQKAFVYKHVSELEPLHMPYYFNSDILENFEPANVLHHVKPTDNIHPSLLKTYETFLQSALNYGSHLSANGKYEDAIKVFSSSLAPGYLLLESHTWSDTTYFKFYSGVMVELIESGLKIERAEQVGSIVQLWDERQLDYLKENHLLKKAHQPYYFSKARLHDAFNEREQAISYYQKVIAIGINSPSKDDLIMGISLTRCLQNHIDLNEIPDALAIQEVGNELLAHTNLDFDAFFLLSSMLYRILGQYDKAEVQLLEQEQHVAPNSQGQLNWYVALINLYMDWEKPDEAKTYKQLIWQHPMADTLSTGNILLKARFLDLTGKTYNAYELLKEKSGKFTNEPNYLFYLADLAHRLYYPNAAFSHLMKRSKGDTSFNHVNTVNQCVLAATILVQRNNKFKSQLLLDEALVQLKNYPANAPIHAAYYNGRALWFASMIQPDSAVLYFQKAIEHHDPNRTTLGKYQVALNHAQMLINFAKYEEAGEILGDLLYEQKRLPSSKNLLVAEYYYLTSQLFKKMGNDPEGSAHFRKKSMDIYRSILPETHPIFFRVE